MAKKIQPYTEWLNEVISKITDARDKAYEDTKEEYFDFLEKKARTNFNRIIESFYNSYDPRFYARRENGDGNLYDLFVVERSKNKDELKIGFEPSKLKGRNGYDGENGLYTTVFLQGYHGGAYIPDAHKFLIPYSAPSTEYDGDTKPWANMKIPHKWKEAERTIAPYRLWKSFVDGYNRGQYQKDFDIIWKRNFNKYI